MIDARVAFCARIRPDIALTRLRLHWARQRDRKQEKRPQTPRQRILAQDCPLALYSIHRVCEISR